MHRARWSDPARGISIKEAKGIPILVLGKLRDMHHCGTNIPEKLLRKANLHGPTVRFRFLDIRHHTSGDAFSNAFDFFRHCACAVARSCRGTLVPVVVTLRPNTDFVGFPDLKSLWHTIEAMLGISILCPAIHVETQHGA
jgi:hypothetical protein